MLSTRSHAAGVPPCSAWYTDAHRTRYPCYHYRHFFARARSLDCFKISRSIQSVSAQSSKFRLSDWYRCDNVMDAASHWYRCDNVMDAAFAVMHRRHRLHAGQGPNHPRSPVCSARRRGSMCTSARAAAGQTNRWGHRDETNTHTHRHTTHTQHTHSQGMNLDIFPPLLILHCLCSPSSSSLTELNQTLHDQFDRICSDRFGCAT